MAKFAPVAPGKILEQFQQKNILGDYHLLLAHDIVSNPVTEGIYQNVFGNRDWDGTIILDNSVIELGTAVDLDVIGRAASICKANVIVLPDVLEDADATSESIATALEGDWIQTFDNVLGEGNYRFMMVPQGTTIEEWKACFDELEELATIFQIPVMWGVPRNIVALHGSRHHALDYLTELNIEDPVHMLGFSDDLTDDIACASSYQIVTGIDSAVPIRAAAHNLSFGDVVADPSSLPARGDWWERSRWLPQMADNLLEARDIFAGKA